MPIFGTPLLPFRTSNLSIYAPRGTFRGTISAAPNQPSQRTILGPFPPRQTSTADTSQRRPQGHTGRLKGGPVSAPWG